MSTMQETYQSKTYDAFKNTMKEMMDAEEDRLDAEIEEYQEEEKSIQQVISGLRKDKVIPYAILVFYGLLALHLITTVIGFSQCIYFIEIEYLDLNTFSVIFWMCLPIVSFISSTCYKFWNFHMRKNIILWLTASSLIVELAKFVYLIVFSIFVPLIVKLPIVQGISCAMILYLMRLVLVVFTFSFIIWMYSTVYNLVSDKYTMEMIKAFRIDTYINKDIFASFDKYSYNSAFIWRMSSGFKYVIREKDRFLHMLVDGVTGSGKTSSAFIPMVVDDLDCKVRNEDALKKELCNAVQKGTVRIVKSFKDNEFSIHNFAPKKGYENVLKTLEKNYRSAGMTILAPDASLTDQVYDFCQKRSIKCNRIDPELDPETLKKKPGCVGFNPLYISPSITPEHPRYHMVVAQKASLFADVLQAIAELGGKSEQYFASLNRNILLCFIILLELTYGRVNPGQQPNIIVLQGMINDFSRVDKYYRELKKDKELAERYQFVIDFINNDINGEGKKKMNEQATGLRIMINELLANPSVREILCSENSVDQDKMLAEGEVTVVNYSQEMGDRDATALGLFFALSFNNACLRRPGTEDTRIPHFYVIDEFPVLMHSQFEKCVTLFRKYRVASCFAIQTLDQMKKNGTLKYLSGVMQANCAHQILYGRINPEEMKLFEQLAGKEAVETEQATTTQTALTTTDPNFSYSSRTSVTEENVMSGASMRNRGFQEVTVFSVKNGGTVKPFHGRLSFLEQKKKKKVKRYHVDWEALYEDYCCDNESIDNTTLLFSSGTVAELISTTGRIEEKSREYLETEHELEEDTTEQEIEDDCVVV